MKFLAKTDNFFVRGSSNIDVSCLGQLRGDCFLVPLDKLFKEIATLLFQWRETNWKLVSTKCFETKDLNQKIDKVIEVLNQMNIAQCNHELYFERDVIKSSLEYPVQTISNGERCKYDTG